MVVLASAFGVVVLVCFIVFPLPPLPIEGSKGLSSIVFFPFSIELTVQCGGCLIWGLGSGVWGLGFGVWGLGSGVAGGAHG